MPELYLVDHEEDPGILFQVIEGQLQPVFFRSTGRMDAIGISSTGPAYFVEPNHNDIFATDGLTEFVVYSHHTYVRNLAFHPGSDEVLYFSESHGAGSDGHIYRLTLGRVDMELFCTVPLSDVGFWAGDFSFDPDGNLYVSSGNQRPASIYRYEDGIFREQYTDDGPIMGFCFADSHTLYFTNHRNHLYRLTDFTDRVLEFEARADARLTDVEFVDIADSGTCSISGHLYGGVSFWPGTTISARGPDIYWRQLEHSRTHPNEGGEYVLENLLPGAYLVLTEIFSEGWAAFLPSNQPATCGSTDIDFTMSREGLALNLLGLECNDAQELTDEVYIIVNGRRIWASSLRTGYHRPIGRNFTFHEDNEIEIWEEDRFRDDRIGTMSLTYEEAIAMIRGDRGPYTQSFHRDRGIVGDATYTLHFDIT